MQLAAQESESISTWEVGFVSFLDCSLLATNLRVATSVPESLTCRANHALIGLQIQCRFCVWLV